MRRIFLPLIVACLAVSLLTGPAFAGSTAMVQLQETVDGILEILRDKKAPSDQRKQKISALVRERFDYGIMAQSAMGKHWRKFTPAQKEEFTAKFSSLLEESYLDRIDAYTDETVDYVKEREKRGKVLIETDIVTANKRIPIHYKLRQRGDLWLVYDVVVEGVSLIRNYRSSYGKVFKKEGFAGLIRKIDAKLNGEQDA